MVSQVENEAIFKQTLLYSGFDYLSIKVPVVSKVQQEKKKKKTLNDVTGLQI